MQVWFFFQEFLAALQLLLRNQYFLVKYVPIC